MMHYLRVLLIVSLLCACSAPANRAHPLVAVLLSSNDAQTRLFKTGLQDAAQKKGVDLWFAEVATSLDQEDRNIAAAITRRPLALIVTPVSPEGSLKAMQKAYAAGIRLICYATCVNEPGIASAFISGPDRDLGRLSGDKALEWIIGSQSGIATIGILPCAESQGCQMRLSEFASRLNQMPGVAIYELPASSTTVPDQSVSSLMTDHPEINLIWAASSEDPANLEQAVKTVQALGYTGKVHILGAGLDPAVNELLHTQSNILLGVAVPLPYLAGFNTLKTALDLSMTNGNETGMLAVYVTASDQELAQQILTSNGKLLPAGAEFTGQAASNQTLPTQNCFCNPTAHPVIPTPP